MARLRWPPSEPIMTSTSLYLTQASAPLTHAVEVMNDAHMHERGMLQHVNHPSLGDVILPNSPLRLHGADRVDPVPSPLLGQQPHGRPLLFH